MAFGKVVIQTEGGERQVHELTKPTTSVGRQAGNDIVLNTTAVSRYHAQFDVAGGRVYLVDLGGVNGTFVNDVQIEPESRVELAEGDVIALGDVLLIFYPRQIRSTVSYSPQSTPVEGPDLPFRVLLEDPAQTVAPGARLQLPLVIENLSEFEQVFRVELGGMDTRWAAANRRQARLDPHEQTEITISIRPPRHTDTRPGIYALTVKVALEDDPTQFLEAVREIDVVGYTGLGMIVQPISSPGEYMLALQNQGNVPLGLKLGGYNVDKLLRYRFEPSEVELEPNETAQVALTVVPAKSVTLGRGQRVPFAVVARSLDEAGYQAPLLAYYETEAKSRAWLAGLLGLPVILISAAAVVLLFLILFFTGVIPGFRQAAAGPEPAAEVTQAGVPGSGATATGFAAEATIDEILKETPTPTLTSTPVPSQTPEPLPTATLEPTPRRVSPQPPPATPAPLVLDFSLYRTGPVEVTFGQTAGVEFTWTFAGIEDEVSLMDGESRQLTLDEESRLARRWAVTLVDLVRIVGWGENVYNLTVDPAQGEVQQYNLTLIVRPVECIIAEQSEVFSEPRLDSTPLDPLPAPEVVILGVYQKQPGTQTWLRVAPFLVDDPDTLAEFNHRWLLADQLVMCDGQTDYDLSDYLPLSPTPIPPPPGG